MIAFTEPFTEIMGGKDLFIDQHSSINLTCIVNSPEPPAHIFWMKNGKVKKYILSIYFMLDIWCYYICVFIKRLLVLKRPFTYYSRCWHPRIQRRLYRILILKTFISPNAQQSNLIVKSHLGSRMEPCYRVLMWKNGILILKM